MRPLQKGLVVDKFHDIVIEILKQQVKVGDCMLNVNLKFPKY